MMEEKLIIHEYALSHTDLYKENYIHKDPVYFFRLYVLKKGLKILIIINYEYVSRKLWF